MSPTICILYSCSDCGLQRRKFNVPARQAEAVTDWMETTTERLAQDHIAASPGCLATSITEMLIPTEGAIKIGGASVIA